MALSCMSPKAPVIHERTRLFKPRDDVRAAQMPRPGSRKLQIISPLLIAACFAACARGRDYYLSSHGGDHTSGTLASPWRSLQAVSTRPFAPGDRILLKGGESFTGLLLLNSRSHTLPDLPVTIGSFGGGRATIAAGKGSGILIRNLGGVVVQDLIVTSSGRSRNQGFGVEVVNERGSHRLPYVRLQNLDVSGFRWAGIYVGGSPTDLPGTAWTKGSRYGFEDVQILSCKAHDNTYYGIYVSGPWNRIHSGYANARVTIRDCEAFDNPGDPCYTQNHSGNGILLDDTDGGLIEKCKAHNTGAANGSKQGGLVGIWTNESNAVVIQFCKSYANRTGGAADGGGFDLDGGVTHSLVQYNYSYNNDGAGYLVWHYWGAAHPLAHNVIRYNLSINDGRKNRYGGIHLGAGHGRVDDIMVYNNTVYTSAAAGGEPRAVWQAASQRTSKSDSGITFS